jgi:hypothetical protein
MVNKIGLFVNARDEDNLKEWVSTKLLFLTINLLSL